MSLKRKSIKSGVKKPLTVKKVKAKDSETTKKTKKKLSKIHGTKDKELVVSISNDSIKKGSCIFSLNRNDIKNINDLMKPLSKMEEYMIFLVSKDSIKVAQNQDSVIALLDIKAEFEKEPKEDFILSIPKEMLANLNKLVSDSVIFKIKDADITLEIGDTKLSTYSNIQTLTLYFG